MAKVWRARETTVKIVLAASISIDTATPLHTEFTNASATSISAYMKNVTVVQPEADVEIIHLLGVDASSFQNAQLEKKPYGIAEVTGTLLVDSGEVLEPFIDNTAVAVTGGYSRYQVGNAHRPEVAVLIALTDATYYVNFVLDNAWMTKLGDWKIDSADGHWEVEVSIKCLPCDFYWEYKD